MGITLEGDSDEAIKFGQDHSSHGIPIMSTILLVVSVKDDKRCTPRFCITILLLFFIEVLQMWVTNLQTPQQIFTKSGVQTFKRHKYISLLPNVPSQLCGQPRQMALSMAPKVQGQVDDQSPPASIEVKNKWNYTSIHTICLQGIYSNNFSTFTINIYTHLTMITNLCNLLLCL
jgi:hypothetical protein